MTHPASLSPWSRCTSTNSQGKRLWYIRGVGLVVGAIVTGGIIGMVIRKYNMPENSSDFLKGLSESVKHINTDANDKGEKIGGFMIAPYLVDGTKQVKSFNSRPDDIYVSSYPKSGTTWLQHVISLILNGSGSARTETKTIEERFPFLEHVVPGMEVISKMPSRRLIKTHLPMSLLPADIETKKPKILYIARNPKDVVVSYQHFLRMVTFVNYNGTLEDMYDDFINDKAPYTPWTEHVKQYWDRRDDENILFLTYEEMSKDLPSCVRKVAEFLGKNLPEEEVQAICQECTFTAMKQNDTTNYSWFDKLGIRKPGEAEFMRKGKVGDWKTHLTPEMSGRLDKMLEEKITPLGLNMTCDIDEWQNNA